MASVSDLLFEMTEWLRTTPILDLALWTDTTSLRNFYQEWFYWIPILQTIHIISIAVTFGSALMLNFRILGMVGGHRTMPQAMDRYARVIWWGLLVIVVSGINLVISEPIRDLVNPFFWLKMGLIVAVVPLNALFNGAVKRKMTEWDAPSTSHGLVRLGAIAMILVWCAIMAGGRLIAYAPV